jgi:hypothetical protein
MAKIKTKVNSDLLRVATTQDDVTSDVTRAEIQTKIAHKQLDKERIQLDIEELEEEIEILDA